MHIHDLSGTWRYHLEDEPAFSQPAWDDSAWARMHIPQNWFLAGVEHHGVVWFRHTFHFDSAGGEMHRTLRFDGVDYFADVYLNGNMLGKHAGYFEPFAFDVTETLQTGLNVLAVRVNSPYEQPGVNGWHMRKRLIKGILNHHDCRPGGGWEVSGQSHNTGGIWNRVQIIEHSPITVEHMFLSAHLQDEAALQADLVIRNRGPHAASDVTIEVTPDNFTSDSRYTARFEREIPPGMSTLSLTIPVPGVQRWEPYERGFPHLYEVELVLDGNESSLATRREVFGFRTASIDKDYRWTVNEKPFFPRGSNYIASQWLSETLFPEIAGAVRHPFEHPGERSDQPWFERDVALMQEAHLNVIRVHAHVLPPEFHAACDRAGLLVWQDFPFQWGYADDSGFHTEAERQVKAMARLLYNHPSIAVWCVHNESPWDADWMAEEAGGTHDPDHNRSLDIHLADTLRRMDRTRYTHVNSGSGDGHTYPGWYSGHWKEYARLPAAPFPTEYGAQALPIKDHLLRIFPDLGPDAGYGPMIRFLQWLREHPDLVQNRQLPGPDQIPEEHHIGWRITQRWRFHDFQPLETFIIAGIPMSPVLERFIEDSQDYQNWVLQYATETYRRHRSEITGVFQFMFTDPWPAITWAVLDYWRSPKPAFEVLGRAMQPVLPVAPEAMREMPAGPTGVWTLQIINDLTESFPESRCEWLFVSGAGDTQRSGMPVDIPAFGISNPLQLPSFELSEGENVLGLFLYNREDQALARNRYIITGVDRDPAEEEIPSSFLMEDSEGQ